MFSSWNVWLWTSATKWLARRWKLCSKEVADSPVFWWIRQVSYLLNYLTARRSSELTVLGVWSAGLQSEHLMTVEWEKSSLQELDITATDLSTECLIDMLTRIPNLRFLRAGQINGFNDSVSTALPPQSTLRLDYCDCTRYRFWVFCQKWHVYGLSIKR